MTPATLPQRAYCPYDVARPSPRREEEAPSRRAAAEPAP
jgi:hypothetical protein